VCGSPALLQVLAPFGALLSRRFPLTPMTDNACVSIHAAGPAAAHSNSNGATCPRSSLSGSEGGGVDASYQVQLLAITEDPWGSSYHTYDMILESSKLLTESC